MAREAYLSMSFQLLQNSRRKLVELADTIHGIPMDQLYGVTGEVKQPMLKLPTLPQAGVVYPGTEVTFFGPRFSGDNGFGAMDLTATIPELTPSAAKRRKQVDVIGRDVYCLAELDRLPDDEQKMYNIITVDEDRNITVATRIMFGTAGNYPCLPLNKLPPEDRQLHIDIVTGAILTTNAVLIGMATGYPAIDTDFERTETEDS